MRRESSKQSRDPDKPRRRESVVVVVVVVGESEKQMDRGEQWVLVGPLKCSGHSTAPGSSGGQAHTSVTPQQGKVLTVVPHPDSGC